MLAFRSLRARLLGDPGPLATRRILDPAVRQIEPHVDRRVPLAVRQHAEHRDLTIVDLAQSPSPLPSDAHRAVALFGEAALVDDQRARRLAAQQGVRVPPYLRQHRLVVPRRVADEMLKLLRAATLNHGGHRLERESCACASPRKYRQATAALSRPRVLKKCPWRSRKAANSATIISTNDTAGHHPRIRLLDELPASFRPQVRRVRTT
jgi:hypothetical protein